MFRNYQMIRGYARHLFIGLAPSLAAIEGQGERGRLAHVVSIGRGGVGSADMAAASGENRGGASVRSRPRRMLRC
jgi:hypothetical protein